MEARQSESTPPPDETQQQLEQYAEEYRERVAELAQEIYLGDNIEQSFEGLYQALTGMSVMCMDLYIKLRWTEDMLRAEEF